MKNLILFVVLALSACASTSGIIPLGQDKYMIGSHVRGGLTSWAEVKGMAVQQAAIFCTSQNKSLEVISIETSGVQGFTPQNADVTFTCKSPK